MANVDAQEEWYVRPGSFYSIPNAGGVAPADLNDKYNLAIETELTSVTGVKEDMISRSVSVYPNPSNGQFIVDLHLAERINAIAKLQLIDVAKG